MKLLLFTGLFWDSKGADGLAVDQTEAGCGSICRPVAVCGWCLAYV